MLWVERLKSEVQRFVDHRRYLRIFIRRVRRRRCGPLLFLDESIPKGFCNQLHCFSVFPILPFHHDGKVDYITTLPTPEALPNAFMVVCGKCLSFYIVMIG